MTQRIELSDGTTQAIIDDLFAHPPVNEAELKQRMALVDTQKARRLVVDRLDRGTLPERGGPLFLSMMNQLGTGRQKQRLMGIALDSDRDEKDRLWAAMTITSEDPKAMDILVSKLGPEGMGILVELSLLELLTMQDIDEIGTSIATALENLLQDRPLDELLGRIEDCRVGIGISCTAAYEKTLLTENLAHIRGKILDLIVREASETGIAMLSRLRDSAKDDTARREFQSALLKLGSRRIDPECAQSVQQGHALVSNCDGQGDFVLLGVFENPDDTSTVADICIRAHGGLRDGVVYPRRSSREVAALAEEIQQQLGCFFVNISLREAAQLVSRVTASTAETEEAVTRDAQHAKRLFERIPLPTDDTADTPRSNTSDLPNLDLQVVCDLLDRPEYNDTWYFDLGDLSGIQMASPADETGLAEWIQQAAQRLDTPPVKTRLIAMVKHMAQWHRWNDEPEVASLCTAIAADVQEDLKKSALITVMLDRSAKTVKETVTELSCQFGDPSSRQRLKMTFFYSVTNPKGTDLARLDLVEAAASALNAAFDFLPGEQRPRSESRDTAAFEIGTLFADHVIAGKSPLPKAALKTMAQALKTHCQLSESECRQMLATVVPSLYSFVEKICALCPINCFSRPDGDVSDVFFSPQHPLSPDRIGFDATQDQRPQKKRT
ncbi:MAG: hypothetical protein QNJ97_05475 [Myxococcota bacterium]|nr:hypothetical protein [Myxococcota bacterium]